MQKIILMKIAGGYGLSNRIRSMAGHYALAKMKGYEIFYEWKESPSCPGTFKNLFDSKLVLPYGEASTIVTAAIEIRPGSTPTHCGSTPNAIFKSFFNDNESKLTFDSFVNSFYLELKPVEELSNLVKSLFISNYAEKSTTVGLHIRRTDMVEHAIKLGEALSTDEEIVQIIDKYLHLNPSVKKIYLACDNEESEVFFRQKYEVLFFSNKKNWHDEGLSKLSASQQQLRMSSLDESMVDLLCLANCKFIIGTKHSSFSTFAAKLGGIKLVRV
jgi:hypothetical protein